MVYPKLKVKLNKKLDLETALNFINYKYAGIDFGKGIIFFHKDLKNIRKLLPKKLKEELKKYIDKFYLQNKKQLNRTEKLFLNQWNKISEKFFVSTNRMFNNYEWPKGKYVCYVSIFPCNPRFLKDKTFQVFYKDKKDSLRLICHEMLHFIFYDYLKKSKTKLNEEKKWEISEIFNVLAINRKEFKKLIKLSKEIGYPEHKQKIKVLKNKLRKNWKIDDFLSLVLLNNKNDRSFNFF